MYKIETLKKVMDLMRAKEVELDGKNLEDIKMTISRGNKKIGKTLNVSLPPIRSCGNCKECSRYCYDVKACVQYSSTVIDARMRNYVILKRDRARYFREIDQAMTRRRRNKSLRWQVAGDIVDMDYLNEMVENAKRHPDFIIWTYTKMYHIVNDWIATNGNLPGNLTIMFSEWDGLKMENPYNMPIFACKLKAGNHDRTPESFNKMYKCPGNCDICKANHRGCIAGEDTYAIEH